ncbi:MAG: transglutaminase domain-containing protein [Theionarchaea archaeon]|nr:transglutaminase domain-containing protein [Theionarchaea archaeon]MBU7038815.1 transglutaminase domain-containing protein [Theionarchaea archaeon]
MNALDVLSRVDGFFFVRSTSGGKPYYLYYRIVLPVLSRVSTWSAHFFLQKKHLSIDGVAEGLTGSAKSDEDKIRILFNYVETWVKRLPLRGWFSPEEVNALRYGDCKHMSVLLSALLNHIGKESKVVVGFVKWKRISAEKFEYLPRLHAWVKVKGTPCFICDPLLHYVGSEEQYETMVGGTKELYYLENDDFASGGSRKIRGRLLV